MGKGNFSEKFKRDAVRQITERGCPVGEVSQRPGVSPKSLYAWREKFLSPSAKASDDEQSAENRRLKRELARVTGERDISR